MAQVRKNKITLRLSVSVSVSLSVVHCPTVVQYRSSMQCEYDARSTLVAMGGLLSFTLDAERCNGLSTTRRRMDHVVGIQPNCSLFIAPPRCSQGGPRRTIVCFSGQPPGRRLPTYCQLLAAHPGRLLVRHCWLGANRCWCNFEKIVGACGARFCTCVEKNVTH